MVLMITNVEQVLQGLKYGVSRTGSDGPSGLLNDAGGKEYSRSLSDLGVIYCGSGGNGQYPFTVIRSPFTERTCTDFVQYAVNVFPVNGP
ncbi:MAG: hypothetical protein V1736_00160, partial [Pseudomonadota bacterium]